MIDQETPRHTPLQIKESLRHISMLDERNY